MKKKLTAILLSLGVIFGFGLVAAPSASAYNTYYHGHNGCYYKGVEYMDYGGVVSYSKNVPVTYWYVHVDYTWQEEVFQGKYDYEYYSHKNIYWNGICG